MFRHSKFLQFSALISLFSRITSNRNSAQTANTETDRGLGSSRIYIFTFRMKKTVKVEKKLATIILADEIITAIKKHPNVDKRN